VFWGSFYRGGLLTSAFTIDRVHLWRKRALICRCVLASSHLQALLGVSLTDLVAAVAACF
jgi:hypothetical protein